METFRVLWLGELKKSIAFVRERLSSLDTQQKLATCVNTLILIGYVSQLHSALPVGSKKPLSNK